MGMLINDMSGKLIQAEFRIVPEGIEVLTSDRDSGVYVIALRSDERSIQKRIIIN